MRERIRGKPSLFSTVTDDDNNDNNDKNLLSIRQSIYHVTTLNAAITIASLTALLQEGKEKINKHSQDNS